MHFSQGRKTFTKKSKIKKSFIIIELMFVNKEKTQLVWKFAARKLTQFETYNDEKKVFSI